jgi:hypothetical protein
MRGECDGSEVSATHARVLVCEQGVKDVGTIARKISQLLAVCTSPVATLLALLFAVARHHGGLQIECQSIHSQLPLRQACPRSGEFA